MPTTTTPRAHRIFLNPELAEQLMDRNRTNRKFRPAWSRELKDNILTGRYIENGDSIRIAGTFDPVRNTLSREAILLNGQHTCQAVIDAGQGIPILLVDNLHPASYETMDTGLRRTVIDVLRANGEVNITSLAAATHFVHLYIHWMQSAEGEFTNQEFPVRPNQIRDILDLYRGLRESVNSQSSGTKRRGPAGLISPSYTCGLHYLFSQVDPDHADSFIKKLKTGENITGNLLLCRTALSERGNKQLSPLHKVGLVIKTWNKECVGSAIRSLRMRTRGRVESFPEIFGLRQTELFRRIHGDLL